MNAILLAAALNLLGPVKLTVNAKDGESIAGDRYFKVSVQADNPITKVEFYVNNEFRGDDTSTPYEFNIDALAEKEGEIEVKFKAFTSESEQGQVVLKLRVDNGLDKGVDFHAVRGKEDINNGKFDDAITEGRIIMKIDAKSTTGQLLLARGNYGKAVLDKAQKYAEDALAAEPENVEGLELLAAINLQRAFKTFNRGADAKDTLATIKNAMAAAADSRRKSLNVALDKIGAPTDANLLQYADAAIRANRFSLAISALEKTFSKDQRKPEIGNRLAFALMRSGKLVEAYTVLNVLKKNDALTAYSYALKGVLEADSGDVNASKASITEGLVNDSNDLGLTTAQAYIALQQNNSGALSKLTEQLLKTSAQRYEVQYFLSSLYNRLQNYPEGARYFRNAVLTEPASADVYIETANYSLGIGINPRTEAKDKDIQLETASMYYNTALVARPESAEALAGMAVVYLGKNDPTKAIDFAQAAIKAQPTTAVGYYALSAALNAQAKVLRTGNGSDKALNAALQGTQTALKKASDLDKRNLDGRPIPSISELYRYLKGGGRSPFISAPR